MNITIPLNPEAKFKITKPKPYPCNGSAAAVRAVGASAASSFPLSRAQALSCSSASSFPLFPSSLASLFEAWNSSPPCLRSPSSRRSPSVSPSKFKWHLRKKAARVIYLHFALQKHALIEQLHDKQEQSSSKFHETLVPDTVRKPAIWSSRTMAFTRSSKTFFFSFNLLQRRTCSSSTPQPFNAETICRILSANPTSTVDASLTNIPVQMSPELAVDVLKKLSNAGVLALSFFRWVEKQQGFKHTTESFHELIESLGKIRQFKMIWTLLSEMNRKKLLTRETFSLVSRRYARARKVKEAVEAFEKMEQYGMKPQVSDFNRLIDVLCKSKRVEKAHEVFDKMRQRKIVPDLKTYTILLEGWGTQGNLLRVDEIRREMESEGFEPDVVTYGIVMNAYCKAKKYDSAVGFYHEMVEKGVRPSPHIYCTLINGLGSDKRLNEALQFFEMSKASGFPPEGPTYNAVVGAYCWSIKMEDAYRVVGEMKELKIGPTSRTYDIILHHLIKAQRNQEAYSIFRRMSSEFGCEPSVSTYEIMVRMFCNEGRLEMAMEVWDQMKSKGILPGMHMFSSLIGSLCNESKVDEACRYFQEMLDMGIRPPAQLFSSFKQALIYEGMENTAIHFALKLDKLRKTPLIA